MSVLTAGQGADTRARQRQAAIDAWLAAYPGGEQTGLNEISYLHGPFVYSPAIVTLTGPRGGQQAPDCPPGWVCLYQQIGFGYPRLRIRGCGWRNLAWWGFSRRVRSVHDHLADATLTLIHHQPGTPAGSATKVLVLDAAANPPIPDTAARAPVDYVYTSCHPRR
jgi:hypothetical protein